MIRLASICVAIVLCAAVVGLTLSNGDVSHLFPGNKSEESAVSSAEKATPKNADEADAGDEADASEDDDADSDESVADEEADDSDNRDVSSEDNSEDDTDSDQDQADAAPPEGGDVVQYNGLPADTRDDD
jgi:hypothetical protein